MNITIFGSGYVGLVTSVCFAEVGNNVTCVDIDPQRVQKLNNGECLIYEPGLEEMLTNNLEAQRIQFTTCAEKAINSASIIFIAVGTPAGEDGSADLQFVHNVASTIGNQLNHDAIIVNKSTVPVGTADEVKNIINNKLQQRRIKINIDIASNPEFLKEGCAVNDFMKPDRVIIGTNQKSTEKKLAELYFPFNRNHDKLICMSPRSAELTKYAANAMLATKISFMNEVSQIAEKVGADIESVRQGIGSDPRIGFQFIYPGCGYGGSCFPKDVQALNFIAKQASYEAKLIQATHQVNEAQKFSLVQKILDFYNHDISGKHFALWGLAFKPNTDDIREAPSVILINELSKRGATITAYDPKAVPTAKNIYKENDNITFCNNNIEAVQNADALVIVTEWLEFRSPDFSQLSDTLQDSVIFDGRNLYQPDNVSRYGLDYICVGRPRVKRRNTQEAEYAIIE